MITPIEMYSMIPKSHEAATLRQGEIAKDASQQIGGLQQFEGQTVANSQKTARMEETENPEYRYEGTGGGNGEYSPGGEKKEKEDDSEKEKPKGYVRSDGIDIRI